MILSIIFLSYNNCANSYGNIILSIVFSVGVTFSCFGSVYVMWKVNKEVHDWEDRKYNDCLGKYLPCFKYDRLTTDLYVGSYSIGSFAKFPNDIEVKVIKELIKS